MPKKKSSYLNTKKTLNQLLIIKKLLLKKNIQIPRVIYPLKKLKSKKKYN